MVARVSTVAFEGVEARPVDVQVQIASGTVAFTIVGLGNKNAYPALERRACAVEPDVDLGPVHCWELY